MKSRHILHVYIYCQIVCCSRLTRRLAPQPPMDLSVAVMSRYRAFLPSMKICDTTALRSCDPIRAYNAMIQCSLHVEREVRSVSV